MENYLPLSSIWAKAKVSRQRLYQIMEGHNLELPQPDATMGERNLYKPETVEAFVKSLPTRGNRNIQIVQFKKDNPDFMSVQDFIRSKSLKVSDRAGFVIKLINKAKVGEIDSIVFSSKLRLYNLEQMSAEYDKSYGDKAITFAMSRIQELLEEYPNAITKEQFCVVAGVSFPTFISRFYKADPRPKAVFRAGNQSFFDKTELAKVLSRKDLIRYSAMELAKASE